MKIDDPKGLHFSNDFSQNEYQLIQIPPELENIQTVYIKGIGKDDCVLCTDDTTYDLKFSDTSNSLCIIFPEDHFEDKENKENNTDQLQISYISNNFLELKMSLPRLNRVSVLLSEFPYFGAEEENDYNPEFMKKYSTKDIMENVQASEKQIMGVLESINAVEIDGYWRILDDEYAEKVMGLVLDSIIEESCDPNRVSLAVICDSLYKHDVHQSCVAHCLNIISEGTVGENAKTNDDDDDDDETLKIVEDTFEDVKYKLCNRKICKFLGMRLLGASEMWELDAFIRLWEENLSQNYIKIEPDMSLLKGECVITKKAVAGSKEDEKTVIRFSKGDLPLDVKSRFKQLFNLKPHWTLEEITPYLEDVVDPKIKKVEPLLVKYTRNRVVNGVKIYNTKY